MQTPTNSPFTNSQAPSEQSREYVRIPFLSIGGADMETLDAEDHKETKSIVPTGSGTTWRQQKRPNSVEHVDNHTHRGSPPPSVSRAPPQSYRGSKKKFLAGEPPSLKTLSRLRGMVCEFHRRKEAKTSEIFLGKLTDLLKWADNELAVLDRPVESKYGDSRPPRISPANSDSKRDEFRPTKLLLPAKSDFKRNEPVGRN